MYSGPYLQYAGCEENIDAATAYLEEIIAEEGPFDGVIGFSQGAAFAARLLLRQQERDPLGPPLFKMAIFFCCSSLFYFETDQDYKQKMTKIKDVEIQVPTVHIVGTTDHHRPFGLDLIDLCNGKVRKTINVVMGHEIPREKVAIEATREAIEWAVRMTQIGG